jgi:hypothetical protein
MYSNRDAAPIDPVGEPVGHAVIILFNIQTHFTSSEVSILELSHAPRVEAIPNGYGASSECTRDSSVRCNAGGGVTMGRWRPCARWVEGASRS